MSDAELLLELTAHPGWAVLMRETQDKLDAFRASAPFNMKNMEELFFARGVTATLLELQYTREKAQAILAQEEQGED